jgi:hypothetical protein
MFEVRQVVMLDASTHFPIFGERCFSSKYCETNKGESFCLAQSAKTPFCPLAKVPCSPCSPAVEICVARAQPRLVKKADPSLFSHLDITNHHGNSTSTPPHHDLKSPSPSQARESQWSRGSRPSSIRGPQFRRGIGRSIFEEHSLHP